MTASRMTIAPSMLANEIRHALGRLSPQSWLPGPAQVDVELLADGVYHANFTVISGGRRSVARVVRASQWGLAGSRQLKREHAVLSDLARVNVAPIPLALVRSASFPFLVESFVPGRYVDHHSDLEVCAAAIASAHSCAPRRSEHLLDPRPPREFLLGDSDGRLRHCRTTAENSGTLRLLNQALRVLADVDLPTSAPVLVHTDLIQRNLLVEDGRCGIVDWEGTRLGYRAWDLAYFLSPVTLGWAEPPVALTYSERERFLSSYADSAGLGREQLGAEVDTLTPFVLLRALAWCVDFASRAANDESPAARDRLALFTSTDFVAAVFAGAGVVL